MSLPLTLSAYRLATRLATPLSGALLSLRLNRAKEDPLRVDERRGFASLARPEGPLVWLHGASVGEALSLLPLVDRLTQSGRGALVTTGTVTSARLLAQRLPAGALHQFAPLDAPGFMRRFFAHWRPDLALIAESELWPNMILEARRAGAPLVMVNARMSARSFARWRRAPDFIAALLGRGRPLPRAERGRRRAARRARRARGARRRQSEIRRAGAARRPAGARRAGGADFGAPDLDRRFDP